jgi:hypothetical protein
MALYFVSARVWLRYQKTCWVLLWVIILKTYWWFYHHCRRRRRRPPPLHRALLQRNCFQVDRLFRELLVLLVRYVQLYLCPGCFRSGGNLRLIRCMWDVGRDRNFRPTWMIALIGNKCNILSEDMMTRTFYYITRTAIWIILLIFFADRDLGLLYT